MTYESCFLNTELDAPGSMPSHGLEMPKTHPVSHGTAKVFERAWIFYTLGNLNSQLCSSDGIHPGATSFAMRHISPLTAL